MAIDNYSMRHAVKMGEPLEGNSSDTDEYWIGGSPIAIDNSDGKITGDMASAPSGYLGIALHPWRDLTASQSRVTYAVEASVLTLYQDSSDLIPPWKESLTYAVGDLVRPTRVQESTTSKYYGVWTNEAWGTEQSSDIVPYMGIILQIDDGASTSSAAPTRLTILFTTRYKQS